jgi:hypothetical protein
MDINKDGILDIVLGNNMNLNLSFQGWIMVVVLEIKMELIHGLLTLNQVSS